MIRNDFSKEALRGYAERTCKLLNDNEDRYFSGYQEISGLKENSQLVLKICLIAAKFESQII